MLLSSVSPSSASYRAYHVSKFDSDGIENLHIRVHNAIPKPNAHEVLVKVVAVSLNYRDLMIVRGQYFDPLPADIVPTSDGAGQVIAVGTDVTDFRVGDRVCAIFIQSWIGGRVGSDHERSTVGGPVEGMLSEYVVFPQSGLIHIPSTLSYEEASTLPCAGVTAWHALHELTSRPVSSSDTVVTLGTGGVSIFAVQFAHAAGARVICTSSSDDKIQEVKEKDIGVTEMINYRTHPQWGDVVCNVTNGRGADHIVDIGGSGTLEQTLKAVGKNGQIHLVGFLAAGSQPEISVPLVVKCASIRGILIGSKQMFENMNRTIDFHRIKPVISKVFDFDEAKEAYKYLDSGCSIGKVVIRVAKQ